MKILVLLTLFLGEIFALQIADLDIKRDDISGKFTEKLTIAGFSEPVLSNGEFAIRRGELAWTTLEPVQNELKISADGIWQKSGEQWIKAKDSLFDKETFLAITQLDEAKLAHDFEISLSGDNSAWSATLVPKGAILKQIFKSIEISGAKFVEILRINSANGDVSENVFSDIK